MAWYDVFARYYDRSLEALYAEARAEAVQALALEPGQAVLDLPCGTGQSLEGLAQAVGETGMVVGLDLSAGMLRQARARVAARGWARVRVGEADVHQVDAALLERVSGEPVVLDGMLVALGLTAFPRWEEAFERLWALLRPGGRCVVLDCHADPPSLRGHLVNLVARARIQRRVWEPLERLSEDFERRALPPCKEYGGTLMLARGRKPDVESS